LGLNITTTYPLWYFIICLLTGILFALTVYYRNRKYEFPVALNISLGIIRSILVAFIAFLLLNPLISSFKRHSEKPVIIILQDNTASIVNGKDSSFYKNEFPKKIDDLEAELENKYVVNSYHFSDHLSDGIATSYSGNITNYADVLNEISDLYAYQNVGALIIASDGIYNRGANPIYEAGKLNFPVYTIALGDTNIRKDILIKKINFNRVAYLGNEFPVEVSIGAGNSKNQSAKLTISKNGKILETKTISISTDNYLGQRLF